MNPLDELGAAAHRKLRAQAELRDAQDELDEALRAVHASGICKSHVGEVARFELDRHGFDKDMIRRLGLSDGNVRLILDRI